MANKYRPDIDGLRAIAILSVLLLHADFAWLSGGFVGVDIFFVISGYLITGLIVHDLERGCFSFSGFFIRRARRILPPLIFVAFASLIAGWFFFLPDDFKSLGRSAFALSLFVSNIYFWLKSGYFTSPADTKPLLHTWSLAVEEQFYLLFPLILYVITLYIPKYRGKLIYFFLCLSFALTWWGMKNNQIAAFFLLPFRAWELLLGSIIALYFSSNKKPPLPSWINETISIIGFFAIVYALFLTDKNVSFPEVAIAPCLGAAAIIFSNEARLTLIGRMLSLPFMVSIGLISYSLYLWHWPLLVFTKYIAINELSIFQRLSILTASVILACISYLYIETPFRQKRILSHPKKFMITSASIVSSLFALALIIHFKEGMPQRLTQDVFNAYQEPANRIQPTCQSIAISKNVTVCANAKKDEKPDLILWGDSHADMLLPLIEKLASQYNIKFWYYSCIPLLNVYRVDSFSSLKESDCHLSNHELIKVIEREQINHVLFASFWSQFTEGKEIPMEGAGRRDPFYGDETIKSTSPSQARVVFQTHFNETVTQLTKANAEIWIMQQVPAHKYWIPNQLAKTLKYGGDINQIGRPLVEHLSRQLFVNKVFAEVKADKVHLLDPSSILCNKSEFCLGVENGRALYRDFNHLSDYGAMKLTPLIDEMFLAISNTKKVAMVEKKIPLEL